MKIRNKKPLATLKSYIINIKKIYNTFISVVDKIRSKSNISNNLVVLNNLKEETIRSVAGEYSPTKEYQESRCHAFYRFIGFPVVSKDKKSFYNPGYDIIPKPGQRV